MMMQDKRPPVQPGLVQGMPESKTKIIMASVLILVMALLWVRVLLKKKDTPQNASANTGKNETLKQGKSRDEFQLEYIELPVVLNRHDRLARDIFSRQSSSVFSTENSRGPEVIADAQPVELEFQQIQKELETYSIDAIMVGRTERDGEVFINEKVYKIGSVLVIYVNQQSIPLQIQAIEENKITLYWEGQSFQLKMAQSGLID